MLDSLEDLICIVTLFLDNSKFAAQKFWKDKYLEWLIVNVLKNSKFSGENYFKEIYDISGVSFSFHRKELFIKFLIMILNCVRLNDSDVRNEMKSCKVEEFLLEFQLKLEEIISNPNFEEKGKKIENPIFPFKMCSFLINLHLINKKKNSFILLSDEIFEVIFTNLKVGLEGYTIMSNCKVVFIEAEEILCYLITLTKNSENMKYLIETIPYILHYLDNKWKVNIQILAIQFLYCLSSDYKCKQILINNENFMQLLTSNSRESCREIRYLKENIICEMVGANKYQDDDMFLKENSLIFISSHVDDKKMTKHISFFFKETCKSKNMLYLDSDGKYI